MDYTIVDAEVVPIGDSPEELAAFKAWCERNGANGPKVKFQKGGKKQTFRGGGFMPGGDFEKAVGQWNTLDLVALKSRPHTPSPDASQGQGVPPAPRNPLGQFKSTLALKHWDRERGFVKPVSEFPLADLYACWDKKAIYLGLYTQDVIEEAFYQHRAGDRPRRMDRLLGESNRPIRAGIGAGAEPVCDEPAVRIVHLSGVNLDPRNIAVMEIPAKRFGHERFKSGDTIELASSFYTHGRAYRMEWKGKFTLRSER